MEKPFLIERIIASLSYLTWGIVGFFWLIIGLFMGWKLRPFLQYHIFQSFFLSIVYFLLNGLFYFVFVILGVVPYVNKLVAQITFYLNMPIIMNYSLIQMTVYAIMFYLAVSSFIGMYSKLPYVSKIIAQNVSGR